MTLVEFYFLHYTNSMDEEKRSLYVLLGILAVLAVIGACWRVLSYQQGRTNKVGAPYSRTQEIPNPVPARASEQNITELLEEPTYVPVQTNTIVPSTFSVYQTTPAPAVSYPQNRATVKQTYPARSSSGQRYVDTNFYDTNTKASGYQPQTHSYHATGYVGPHVNFNTPSTTADRMQEERSKMLAPYLRPNQQDKARMDAQWNKLAAGLERALAKALMPKSKKEEMIEKYSTKPADAQVAQMPGFEGNLAPVGQQIATQKQMMVQQMGRAFGGAAAQQAGGIMDSFAGEVSAALNEPNTTAAQKEQQVKEITKKYQDKMDKLAEKKQYDKFVAQRTEEINQQKAEFRSQYGDELSNKLGKNLEEEWQEEQKLALQNLPMDEYNTKISQLHQNKRNERQQLVLAQGKSINPMLEMEKKQEEKMLKDLQQKVQAGEIESVARKATANEIAQMQADVKVKSKDTLDKIAKDPLLGPQAAQEFKPILDNYQTRLNQLYEQELSIDERQVQEGQLLKRVNRQLLDKQIEIIEKLDIPEAQKQKFLEDLNKAYDVI